MEIFGKKMKPTAYDIKRHIGLVPQNPAVYEELSVQENIDYYCGLYIEDRAKRKKMVDETIDFLQLGDFRKFRPKQLSGGLLRRLNLGCGIAHRPRLIFLDEPTVAVDPQSRNRILEGIKQLRDEGATIVYTSHYMEEVEFLCDRLAILDHGEILVSGINEEIIDMSSIHESVDIVAYGIPDNFIRRLQESEKVIDVNYVEGRLSVKIGKGGGLLDILHQLQDIDIEPVSVSSKKPTLNDVFLEITGKELRDHA